MTTWNSSVNFANKFINKLIEIKHDSFYLTNLTRRKRPIHQITKNPQDFSQTKNLSENLSLNRSLFQLSTQLVE